MNKSNLLYNELSNWDKFLEWLEHIDSRNERREREYGKRERN